jgi:hypothetical protein
VEYVVLTYPRAAQEGPPIALEIRTVPRFIKTHQGWRLQLVIRNFSPRDHYSGDTIGQQDGVKLVKVVVCGVVVVKVVDWRKREEGKVVTGSRGRLLRRAAAVPGS